MKRVGLLIMAVLVICSPLDVGALTTGGSSPSVQKTSSPFLITSYSFSGGNIRYVQIFNASSTVESLDGWKMTAKVSTSEKMYVQLSGLVEPGTYVTAANKDVLQAATFTFMEGAANATDPNVSGISLLAPTESPYTTESVVVTTTSSTPKVTGTPSQYYFMRNLSTSTGNYLSTFTAFIPSAGHVVYSDPLYVAPANPSISIVELYPDSLQCSPFDTNPLCKDYVKIKNNSNGAVDLTDYRLRTGALGQSATASTTVRMENMIAPNDYLVVALNLPVSGSWVWLEDVYGTVAYKDSVIQYPSNSGHGNSAWSLDESTGNWSWNATPSPLNGPNTFPQPVRVNECLDITINEIAANVDTEDQFIELTNTGANTVDMTGCKVQTNRSSSASFVLDGTLEPNQYKVLYIKGTSLTLTKTTSGTVYVLSSDGLNKVDAREYSNLKTGTSWGKVGDVWHQSFISTPGMDNQFSEYEPCLDGYFRNIETGNCNKVQPKSQAAACGPGKYRSNETNRCRTISTSISQASCGPGKYRSTETNRCRNSTSALTSLTPCQIGQIRNPATNRCRSVLANASTLKPCSVGQVRNPDTNRCRKATSSSTKADFPVEAIQATANGGTAWWAFGGAGILAAGYAGWEWRREVLSTIKKVGVFFVSGR